MSAESQADAAEISPVEGPKPHTPIQCVTLAGLRLSHRALTNLLDDVSTQMRDKLAEEYGVAVGDTLENRVAAADHPFRRVTVTALSVAVERVAKAAKEPGNVLLVVRVVGPEDATAQFYWNPAEWAVINKENTP